MTLAHSENIGGQRHYFSPRNFHFEHFSCMIFNYLRIALMASVFAPLSFIKSLCVCVCAYAVMLLSMCRLLLGGNMQVRYLHSGSYSEE